LRLKRLFINKRLRVSSMMKIKRKRN